MDALTNQIFHLSTQQAFEQVALEVFRYQAKNVAVYNEYLSRINRPIEAVKTINDIPFLPIELFKHHQVIPVGTSPKIVFESSGTTGQILSKHHVADLGIYEQSSRLGFEHFYGPLSDWCFFGLLPSYIERNNSSLVHMVNDFIQNSGNPGGFYLNQYHELRQAIDQARSTGKKVMIIGVTFGLLDWAKQQPMDLSGATVIETGGMKGRGAEPTREQVHHELRTAFNLDSIGSEYGMTELLSQAYAPQDGIFRTPPWMRLKLREPRDPFAQSDSNESGLINVIDLANIHSCSFIATMDIGRKSNDGMLVLGRADNADLRGCNLMV